MMDWNRVKLITALLLVVAAIGWGYMRTRSVRPGAVANNGTTEEFRGPASPEQRAERIEEIAKVANITPEQRKKLEEARDKAADSGDWRAMRQAANDILTSQQRTQIRQSMESRRAERDQKMRAALGDKDFERYRQKMEERRAQRGGGRGRPDGARPRGAIQ